VGGDNGKECSKKSGKQQNLVQKESYLSRFKGTHALLHLLREIMQKLWEGFLIFFFKSSEQQPLNVNERLGPTCNGMATFRT
jgi:hypothetical protein